MLSILLSNNIQQALGRKITFRFNQKSPCKYNNDSCWTAGITCFCLASGQTLPRTGVLLLFKKDKSLFYPRCPNILELYPSPREQEVHKYAFPTKICNMHIRACHIAMLYLMCTLGYSDLRKGGNVDMEMDAEF